ncbi:type II toxin-antitoxin system RelB family antitoxin [Companilactobacillus kimchiensis]|uniref:type II toxin-antitoxin system RelB family antitoxin n=1 Tax=Companilactobacillus kimchiensis TaxID=993692 RepID=UPI00070C5C0F|nr:DUF6290 family protein [Companilactobacillus kimchiensis]
MAIIPFYLSEHDEKLIENYAKSKHMSVSSFLHSVAMDKIEDDIDTELYERAKSEFKDNPEDVTLAALKRELKTYC